MRSPHTRTGTVCIERRALSHPCPRPDSPVEPAATDEPSIDLVEDDVERARRMLDAYAGEQLHAASVGRGL